MGRHALGTECLTSTPRSWVSSPAARGGGGGGGGKPQETHLSLWCPLWLWQCCSRSCRSMCCWLWHCRAQIQPSWSHSQSSTRSWCWRLLRSWLLGQFEMPRPLWAGGTTEEPHSANSLNWHYSPHLSLAHWRLQGQKSKRTNVKERQTAL